MSDFKGQTAVVTGASAGLGAEFARQLAKEVGTLVLVARRVERLLALKQELLNRVPDLRVEICVADLAQEAERLKLLADWKQDGLEVDLLINNAGLGDIGDLASAQWEKVDQMLQVNMTALTQLTVALLPGMRERKRGCVLNVSSTAGFLPLPSFAAYAATKAYANSLSEALRFELKGTGVTVTALCPGPVATEFGEVAARPDGERDFAPPDFFMIPAEQVVREALSAARRGQARVIPGTKVRAMMLLMDALPTPWMRGLLGLGDWLMTSFGKK